MNSIFNLSYLKLLIAVLLIVAGVTAGVYLGNNLIGIEMTKTEAAPNKASNLQSSIVEWEKNVSVKAGDLFPLENVYLRDNIKSNFEDILAGKKSIIFFSSLTCEKCTELHKYWQSVIMPEADENMQIIICIDSSEIDEELTEVQQKLFASKQIIFYNQQLWVEKYRLQVIPTIFAIDNFGFVYATQTGFVETFIPEIMKFSSGYY